MLKSWTLQATIPQNSDKSSYLPGSSQSFIENKAKWKDALQFASEFYFIKEVDSNSDVVKAFIEAWSSRPFNHQFKFHEDTSRVLASDTLQVLFEEVDHQGLYILSTPESRASIEKFRPKSYEKWLPKVFYKNVPRLINLKMSGVQAQAKTQHERGKRKAALVLLEKSDDSDVNCHRKRRKEDDMFSREEAHFVADPQKEFFKILWSRLFERMSGAAPDSVPSIEDEVQLVLEEAKYFDLFDVSSVEKSSEILSTEVLACDEADSSFSEVRDPYGGVQTKETKVTDQFEKTKKELSDLRERLRESSASLQRQPFFFQEFRARTREFDRKFDSFLKNLSTLRKLAKEDLKRLGARE